MAFAFYSQYSFHVPGGPQNWRDFVIRCKGCGNNIPAPVETLPAVKCPLCGEYRRYLPGRVSGQSVLSASQETSALCTERGKVAVFDPDANMPRVNRGMVYLGAVSSLGYDWRARSRLTFV
jgi:hypothetical protein